MVAWQYRKKRQPAGVREANPDPAYTRNKFIKLADEGDVQGKHSCSMTLPLTGRRMSATVVEQEYRVGQTIAGNGIFNYLRNKNICHKDHVHQKVCCYPGAQVLQIAHRVDGLLGG